MLPGDARFKSEAPDDLKKRRKKIEPRLSSLPNQYANLIGRWLKRYRGRDAAASAVNAWLISVRPGLIKGIQQGIHLWLQELGSIQMKPLPVWPIPDWEIKYEPICTRRFVNRARLGEPMFRQKDRDLCGSDARFIGLIAAAVLCEAGLTADDDSSVPSNDLEDFVLVFDHIHRYMHSIDRQQASTIETIESRRQEGHKEWLGRVPAPPLQRPSRRKQADAERIFDWAFEQTWPMSEMRSASLATVLRKQKLWQVRRPILDHVQKQRSWTEEVTPPPARPANDLPLTLSSAFMVVDAHDTQLVTTVHQSIELLARDLLTLGLWCLQANIDPDTEELLNETLYVLSTKLVSHHQTDKDVTPAQLLTLLETTSET
jgi:hypothetical protein